ncbi:MAG TPA: hypothetical protein EYP31_03965, partial [Roseibacterium sp.]|nr:hypothetical protein [Roseibacterium sp.]
KSDVIASAGFDGIHRAVADFHELGARAASRGLRVGCEALAWGKHADVRTGCRHGAPPRLQSRSIVVFTPGIW